MTSNKALSGLATLLLLAGCGDPPEPNKPEPETPRLTAVSVTCAPTSLTAGQSTQCTASATDQNGAAFSVSSFTWTSGDEAIARVDTSGKVSTVAISSGNVSIRARAGESIQGEASLAVAPKPPTVHSAPISSSETWRALDNPHLVSGALTVDASATLTLEKGAVIRFAPDAELKVVRGSLQAPGTAQEPVLLQAQNGGRGTWKGLVLAAKDTASSLEFVTLSGCGGPQGAGACLVIRDGAVPVLKDVTVKDSASLGVLVATNDSGFGAGSARLSVSGSTGAAVRLDANQAGTLPAGGTFTNNTPNVVELTGATITRTQTWPNPGIPYVVKESLTVRGESSLVTLTVSAGTQVRFASGTYLLVGQAVIERGGLVLDGTSTAPVLLTADSDNPQPGHWYGVHMYVVAAGSRISHATIEYAGKLPKAFNGSGNLSIYGGRTNQSSVTVTDLIAQKSGSYGIDVSGLLEFGVGTARLTSRNNADAPVIISPNSASLFPRDFDFRDNGSNTIAIANGYVVRSQTWPTLGLPYLITESLTVGFAGNPTLTLTPGTEVRARPGALILVGYEEDRPGALVAEGTADAPIRFGPENASATNGSWAGLHFWRATGSKLDQVQVTHGGAVASRDYPGVVGSGNVNVHMTLPNFVTRSTFKNARDCAVTVDSGLTVSLDNASLGNVFTANPRNVQCAN